MQVINTREKDVNKSLADRCLYKGTLVRTYKGEGSIPASGVIWTIVYR